MQSIQSERHEGMRGIKDGGSTFLCTKEGSPEQYAVKKILKQRNDIDQEILEKEIGQMKNLSHRNVVKVLEFDQDDYSFIITMEYLGESTLKKWLDCKRNELAIVQIVQQLLQVLRDLHERQIIHGDISPSNIFIERDTDVVLGLFGCARIVHAQGLNFDPYSSPERLAAGDYSSKTDIWSLGVLIYEMFNGNPPFGSAEDLLQADAVPLPKPEGVSDSIWELISSMLTLCPENRPSAHELLLKVNEYEIQLLNGEDIFHGVNFHGEGIFGNGLQYGFSEDEQTLILRFNGKMVNYRSKKDNTWWYKTSHQSVRVLLVSKGIISIGNYAFYNHFNLTTVVLPEGLIDIGEYSFLECVRLNNINFPSTLENVGKGAFEKCKELVYAEFSSPSFKISDNAFHLCGKLRPIDLSRVKYVGEDAFLESGALNDPCFLLELGRRYLFGKNAQRNEGKGFTLINQAIFKEPSNEYNLSQIISFDFAEHIVNPIEEGCLKWGFDEWNRRLVVEGRSLNEDGIDFEPQDFSLELKYAPGWRKNHGKSIKSIAICSNVSSIGAFSFADCEILKYVLIPEGVRRLGYCAFYGCNALTEVYIPSSVEVIDGNPFVGCWNLESVHVHPDNDLFVVDKSMLFNKSSNSLIYCPESRSGELKTLEGVQKICTGAFRECSKLREIFLSDVISIGADAFRDCTELISISIPRTREIGDYAFSGCAALTAVTLPDVEVINECTFFGCVSLPTISIPESVKCIGDYAFGYCHRFTSIVIPEGVERIGKNPFYGCGQLSKIELIGSNFISEDGVLFDSKKEHIIYCIPTKSGEYTIPSKVTDIEPCAFAECNLLEGVRIEKDVSRIGGAAFKNCSRLNKLAFSANVTAIENEAFQNCESLGAVSLPLSLQSIGDYAFAGCLNLETISIQGNLVEIGDGAFHSCRKLNGVIIPNTVQSIGDYAFAYCIALCEITISAHVSTIGRQAFCFTALFRLEINRQITTIANGLFKGCSCLKEVALPNTVEKIEADSFCDCINLEKITIPESVVTIEGNPFANCKRLSEINLTKNAKFLFLDGILYENDMSHIYHCCLSKQKGVEILGSVSSVSCSAFRECKEITAITIPKSITRIEPLTFAGIHVTQLIIPDTVQSICDKAFIDCVNLQSIEIPKSVVSIGVNPFAGCLSLYKLIVSKYNQHFASNGNALFDKSETFLVCYAACSNKLDVPNTIEIVGESAFEGCSKLVSVELPPSVVSIQDRAFCDCKQLGTISLPTNLRRIGKDVFSKCERLRTISVPRALKYKYDAFPASARIEVIQ